MDLQLQREDTYGWKHAEGLQDAGGTERAVLDLNRPTWASQVSAQGGGLLSSPHSSSSRASGRAAGPSPAGVETLQAGRTSGAEETLLTFESTSPGRVTVVLVQIVTF